MHFAGRLSIPQLLLDLQAEDRATRLQAVADLGKIGNPAALPGLGQALKDADTHVRKLAALALGDLGPQAQAAVSALLEALNDPEASVRRRSAMALGEVGSLTALTGLQAAVADADAGVRRAARTSLEMIQAGERCQAA